MPRDPFADDPFDPASFLDAEEPVPPLSAEERAAVVNDLAMLAEFVRILKPKGIDGVFFFCEDCEEEHYYEWEIMAANMHATLSNELAPVHEPGANIDPAKYVPWDYAMGYVDGFYQR